MIGQSWVEHVENAKGLIGSAGELVDGTDAFSDEGRVEVAKVLATLAVAEAILAVAER